MISQISGTLSVRELDRVELLTAGGVGYELLIPLGVYEVLPAVGGQCTLHTHLVVREDGWQLYGFASTYERRVFQRLLGAKGVGPALALGMLSTLTAERLVRAIRERDVPTLQGVPRVGRKKAEQLILDLADKLDELQVSDTGRSERPSGADAEDAVRALVALGYTVSEAERGVRHALEDGEHGVGTAELIRRALGRIRV